MPAVIAVDIRPNPTIDGPQSRGSQPVTSAKIASSRAASSRRFGSTPASQTSRSSAALFVFASAIRASLPATLAQTRPPRPFPPPPGSPIFRP